LQNKTAIVTGGDSGIGRAAAIMFAREGCTSITVSYLPEEHQDAQDAKIQIEKAGSNVNLVSGNLMEEENCKRLVDSHLQRFGKLNVLVNNASKQMYVCSKLKNFQMGSISMLTLPSRICKCFDDINLSDVESTFRSNIFQMFAITKFALPHLKRGSSIINTTSVTAYKGSSGLGVCSGASMKM
jgi:NAD(P)-dependent dehydrogenase (short-subunit alcohol dehydrogenase family)